jgi:hypothetical protein
MANRLLSVLDSQWIEASADRVLVMSLTNFAGVLEALATRQREFATTCSNSALLQQLDALRLFGVHECDHRYAVLEAAFAQYDVVIKEVGPALGGKKKPKKSSKKRGVHFDAARLDAFNAKIADRQRAVASSRDEFARACDMLADHKLAVLARSVDHVLAAAGSLARDSTALFRQSRRRSRPHQGQCRRAAACRAVRHLATAAHARATLRSGAHAARRGRCRHRRRVARSPRQRARLRSPLDRGREAVRLGQERAQSAPLRAAALRGRRRARRRRSGRHRAALGDAAWRALVCARDRAAPGRRCACCSPTPPSATPGCAHSPTL